MKMIIYKTTNIINGKIYIGQKSKHKGKSIKSLDDLLSTDYFGSSKQLKADIKEFGVENFKREVLEEGILTKEELNARETFWNIKHNATDPVVGYNISKQAWPFHTDCKHTDEAKKKMSDAKKGKSNGPMSEETKLKISLARIGKKHSDATKKKLSEMTYNRKSVSEETRKKLSMSGKGRLAWNKGIECTEETKLKIGNANKGKEPWNKGIKIEQLSKEVEEKIEYLG